MQNLGLQVMATGIGLGTDLVYLILLERKSTHINLSKSVQVVKYFSPITNLTLNEIGCYLLSITNLRKQQPYKLGIYLNLSIKLMMKQAETFFKWGILLNCFERNLQEKRLTPT